MENTRPGDVEMPFTEHLGELRNRIIWSVMAWALCSVAAWFIAPYVIGALRGLIGKDTEMVFLRPTEAFMVYFKIALIGGLFLSLPIILYQITAFVIPGLEPAEKRWLVRLLPAALTLFVCGALFAYYALLPTTLGFFLNFQKYFQDENIKTMISVSEYVGFVMLLTIVCGLIFEMPIVIVALALVGVVNSTMLRNGRRYAILIIFIVAAVATPTPDALTQTVVAIPMILLYEISILIVRGLGR